MKKLWNRFLVAIGFRKPNPHNMSAQDISLGEVPNPSPIAGAPEVFRTTPAERGPLELPRSTTRRVVTPPRFSGGDSRSRPLPASYGRQASPSSNSNSQVQRDGRPDDLLDGLTAFVVASALLGGDEEKAAVPESRPVIAEETSTSYQEQITQNQREYSNRWAEAQRPEPVSRTTSFDDDRSASYGSGSGSDNNRSNDLPSSSWDGGGSSWDD
uniref:Uncharacterized protein n=1 Tax=Pseudomonas phage RVTF4 TaxID=3236931 RepID=A0AB39CDH4_9VIRU